MRSLLALLLLLAACRTQPLDFDGGAPGNDLAATGGGRDMATTIHSPDLTVAPPTSCCGKIGNPGNELGVGKFCQTASDCAGNQASVCTATFQPAITFCTMPCAMNGGAGQCGSGASCQCNGPQQCACVPGECLMPPPGC
jgi:hypothetical protein